METTNNNIQATNTEVIDDSAQTQEPSTVEQSNNTNNEKTFTQSELDSIIEKRLAKEQRKWEKKLKEEADEAARLATMSEAEKQEELFNKRVKAFEEKEAEFLQMQESFKRERVLNETTKQLLERDLPIEFADKVIADTAEGTLANINVLEQQWKAAIDKAVDSKLKGSTPTSPLSKKPEKKLNTKTMSFSDFVEYKNNNK
jgi:hypothetical protein